MLILCYPTTKVLIIIEADRSDYISAVILSEFDDNHIRQLVIVLFKMN
jgi:hypothetical protein